MKTSDIEKEIETHASRMPQFDIRDLRRNEKFVIVSKFYNSQVFGQYHEITPGFTSMFKHHENVSLFEVVKKTRTMVKVRKHGDPIEKAFNITLLAASRDKMKFASATEADVEFIRAAHKRIKVAAAWQAGFVKRSRDIYVLWNFASDPSLNLNLPNETHEGFVVEVFNGNGELQNRSRMICTEGDPVNAGDEIENMVRGYAAAYFSHVKIKDGAKFQICYVPEMD